VGVALGYGSSPKFGPSLSIFLQWLKLATSNSVFQISEGGLGLLELPKILVTPIIFLQRLVLATPNLARSWGLPRPIIKLHTEERVGVVVL